MNRGQRQIVSQLDPIVTHTAPSPTATLVMPLPTRVVRSMERVFEFNRETVPSVALPTHTAPFAATTLLAPLPTGNTSTTSVVAGSIRAPAPLELTTQIARSSTAKSVRW